MKKQTILSKSIASAAALMLCVTAAQAATLVNGTNGAGELFIGFRATGGTGSTKNVVIDVGSAATLAALASGSNVTGSLGSTGSLVNLATIGTILDSTYGIGAGSAVAWYNRTDLVWSAVAAVGNSQVSVDTTNVKDPTNTLYGSVASTLTYPLNTAGYTRNGSSTQGTSATAILSAAAGVTGSFKSTHTGDSGNIALENTSDSNSWSTKGTFAASPFSGFNTPSGQVFEQAFSVGTVATGVEGALDVYRMIKQGANDPDNSSDGISPNATGGTYQFTLAINSPGDLSAEVLPLVAVPEPASLGGLFSAALLGIGALRRKRGAKA